MAASAVTVSFGGDVAHKALPSCAFCVTAEFTRLGVHDEDARTTHHTHANNCRYLINIFTSWNMDRCLSSCDFGSGYVRSDVAENGIATVVLWYNGVVRDSVTINDGSARRGDSEH